MGGIREDFVGRFCGSSAAGAGLRRMAYPAAHCRPLYYIQAAYARLSMPDAGIWVCDPAAVYRPRHPEASRQGAFTSGTPRTAERRWFRSNPKANAARVITGKYPKTTTHIIGLHLFSPGRRPIVPRLTCAARYDSLASSADGWFSESSLALIFG